MPLSAVLALATLSILSSAQSTGSQRCFRAIYSADQHSFLVLFHDGTYARGEVEESHLDWIDYGLWSDVAEDEYILDSDVDAWDLETSRLGISPNRLINVPLVVSLKAEIAFFLDQHPRRRKFSYDEIFRIQALGGTCLPGDRYVCRGTCGGPWRYGVNVQPLPRTEVEPISREHLTELLEMIDSYVARPDLSEFHMYLTTHSGFTVAHFDRSGVGYSFRAATKDQVVGDLRNAPLLLDPNANKNVPFGFLVEASCSSMASDLQLLAHSP